MSRQDSQAMEKEIGMAQTWREYSTAQSVSASSKIMHMLNNSLFDPAGQAYQHTHRARSQYTQIEFINDMRYEGFVEKDYELIKANRAYFGDFDLIFGAAKLNLKIVDLPIRYRERTYGSTNISRWKHGLLLFRMVAFAARRIKFV